jgi:hypothetical protein
MLEKPTPLGRYLGCHHSSLTKQIPDGYNPTGVEPSLSQLITEGNSTVTNLAKKDKIPKSSPSLQGGRVTATFIKYDMRDFLEQCVIKYVQLSGDKSNLRRVDTPFIDESKEDVDDYDEANPGKLKSIASAVLMKCLYAARMARFDLLRPITALAKRVTKWTPSCDKTLHKLMCYINSTVHVTMYGWVGDSMKDVELALFSDADFAGDKKDAKSQSGMFLTLAGKNTSFPLNAFSKKQGSTSKSTPEAETVAANDALKATLPHLDLWEIVFQRKKKCLSGLWKITSLLFVFYPRARTQLWHTWCARNV